MENKITFNEKKLQVEQIIRSQSITLSQKGYDSVCEQIKFYIDPFTFEDIFRGMDWLSQDGFEGN